MVEHLTSQISTRVVSGSGAIARIGELARELGFQRTLLVADPGLVASGHVAEAEIPLRQNGIEVFGFHDFESNPDSEAVERGRCFAAPLKPDSIIGLGGGSSLDCAKAINFLLTNGGVISDYLGYGKVTRPLLPMIAVPTTSGTGSEAQTYALISDANSHVKMACGDAKAAFRIALLDPVLTLSQPPSITATSGFDAIAHAVETYVTTKRNDKSEMFSREAWQHLEANYEVVLKEPNNLEARAAMQLGAFYAGVAIENSMLGATHACANPLTAHFGTAHGQAIATMLPTVVRWNESAAGARYSEMLDQRGIATNGSSPTEGLARRLEQLAEAGGLRRSLSRLGVTKADLPSLANEAAEQWTGNFNPRPFDRNGALEIYEQAYSSDYE